MSCYCDFDLPKLHDETVRRARKDYKCYECAREIKTGELYELHKCLFDGNWDTFRWCIHCASARPIAADLADCHCWLYGQVWSDFKEHAEEERKIALWRLVVGVKHKWTIRRGPRKGQLMAVPKLLAVEA